MLPVALRLSLEVPARSARASYLSGLTHRLPLPFIGTDSTQPTHEKRVKSRLNTVSVSRLRQRKAALRSGLGTWLRNVHVVDVVVQWELRLCVWLAWPRPTDCCVQNHVVRDIVKLRRLSCKHSGFSITEV